ncbi:MAG: DUF192 domain-containing protein [Candidatus Nitrosocosmicus sp.]|nr:DUF192 domain-containing protein [Candidatus Nitrosocosmicus sp.]
MIYIKTLCIELSIFVVVLWLLNAGEIGFSDANPNDNRTSSTVRIDDMNITAILALTPEEQSTGLAIKETMKENEGMLFVFDTPKKYSFWMKDMKFPIDIIWLDSKKKIVHIEDRLEPCVFLLLCPSYAPTTDSLYVLEVVSNFTNKHEVRIGDQVLFDSRNI